jgi:hypothetical protein
LDADLELLLAPLPLPRAGYIIVEPKGWWQVQVIECLSVVQTACMFQKRRMQVRPPRAAKNAVASATARSGKSWKLVPHASLLLGVVTGVECNAISVLLLRPRVERTNGQNAERNAVATAWHGLSCRTSPSFRGQSLPRGMASIGLQRRIPLCERCILNYWITKLFDHDSPPVSLSALAREECCSRTQPFRLRIPGSCFSPPVPQQLR